MDTLPVEVISHIFKYLSSISDRKVCSLVCRSWYEAYQDPLFRHNEVLHLSEDSRFEVLAQMKTGTRKFLNLVIQGVEIKENSFPFWERFGPNLRNLTIISCDIREKVFVEILKFCEQIECLSVQNCRELFMVGHFLEEADVRSKLKEKLTCLTTLNLSYNRYLSDAIFSRFVSTFPKLTSLFLTGCQISFFPGLYKRYYPQGQLTLSESVLTFPIILDYMTHNAKNLKHLSFGDTSIDNAAICFLSRIQDLKLISLNLRGCFQLSHEAVKTLSSQQKSLTELDLSMCPRVTDGSLMDICSGLENLTVLSVQSCRAITDMGVSCLWRLSKLKYLNLSECDMIEGEGLVQGICHGVNSILRELRLGHLKNMTDDVVVSLSDSLPNLITLDLSFCYNGVTNKSVQSILKNNLKLQTLILTQCSKLTDSGLTGRGLACHTRHKKVDTNYRIPVSSKAEREIVREAKLKEEAMEICKSSCDFSGHSLKSLKGLRWIDLHGCSDITDLSLLHGFEFNELRHVNLSRCSKLTEEGFKHLSEHNRSIESLHLEYCQNVDEKSIYHLLKNLKRLEMLVLGSNKITDSVVPIFHQFGRQLVRLDMRQCGQITTKGIKDILTAFPRLQNFQYSTSKFEDTNIPIPPDPSLLSLR